jgi:hypothetical protein
LKPFNTDRHGMDKVAHFQTMRVYVSRSGISKSPVFDFLGSIRTPFLSSWADALATLRALLGRRVGT